MSTQNIVNVQITREIPAITSVGFGSLLFVAEAETVGGGARIRSYASVAEVALDFPDESPALVASQRYFGQALRPERLYIGLKADDETYVQALTAIRLVNDDWYALAIESPDAADIEAVSDYVQALTKLFVAATADANVIDPGSSGDIASVLLGKTNWRTAVLYSTDAATNFPAVAWAGSMLPMAPGSATWAFKQLTGILPDRLKSFQLAAAEDKRATVYVRIAGQNVTLEGQTSEPGNFADIVRGTDWLRYTMSERIFSQLAAAPKIPYVGGDAIIEQLIRGVLDQAVQRKVIAPNYSVRVPPAEQQQPADRAARRYRDVTFSATLAGAVHGVEVRGVVVVDGTSAGVAEPPAPEPPPPGGYTVNAAASPLVAVGHQADVTTDGSFSVDAEASALVVAPQAAEIESIIAGSFTITAGAQDGTEFITDEFTESSVTVAGDGEDLFFFNNAMAYWSFPSVNIPQGATIASANLAIRTGDAQGTPFTNFVVAGNAAADPALPSDSVLPSAWSATTATQTVTISSTPAAVNNIDVTAIVQEIVNLGGYTGNRMQFRGAFNPNTGRVVQFLDYDDSPAFAAVLTVNYSPE